MIFTSKDTIEMQNSKIQRQGHHKSIQKGGQHELPQNPEFNTRYCGKGIRISYSIKDIRREVLIHKTQLRKHGFPSIYNEVTQLHNLRFIQQLELFLFLFYLQQANLHSPIIMKLRQVRIMVFNPTFNNISDI